MTTAQPQPDDDDFANQAEQADPGLIREFWCFLREYRKWWLLPLIGALLFVGLISVLAAGPAAPFIYVLF